jgi:hypothetical protein
MGIARIEIMVGGLCDGLGVGEGENTDAVITR